MALLTAVVLAVLVVPPTTRLDGTTVDREGKPVSDVELWLMGLPGPDGAPILARGRSGENGRFELERPAGLAGASVDQG
jgi:hypothetical protein